MFRTTFMEIPIIMKYYISILCLLSFGNLGAQTNLYWSTPIDVASSNYGHYFPRIVNAGNGTIYVSWGGNDNVYFSKWSGGTFSSPIQLNNTSTPAFTASWTGPELAARGDTVYCTFMHKIWKQKTYLVRSFDGGTTFSGPVALENYPDSTSRFPMVAIEPGGHPIISFMKMDTNGAHSHYVVRQSTDFGSTFTNEKSVSSWQGPMSEVCDCCPATIKSLDNKVAVFYRNNISNMRDIWTGVSTDNGTSFTNGFAIDNNSWMINSCPSSGPDGIILGDSLYAVFFSGTKSYMSRSSISAASLNTVGQLGPVGSANQNFPRIDNEGKKVAIVWKGLGLFMSFFSDITDAATVIHDTISSASIGSADVVMYNNEIHVVWQDNNSGTVKYSKGTFAPAGLTPVNAASKLEIYPIPVTNTLKIQTGLEIRSAYIWNLLGEKMHVDYDGAKSINVSELNEGHYILDIEFQNGKRVQKAFVIKR